MCTFNSFCHVFPAGADFLLFTFLDKQKILQYALFIVMCKLDDDVFYWKWKKPQEPTFGLKMFLSFLTLDI